MSLTDIAIAQVTDDEIAHLRQEGHHTRQFVEKEHEGYSILCDVFEDTTRPVVPLPLRWKAFEAVHNLAHSGQHSTLRQVTATYWWPDITRTIRHWVKCCQPCQLSKVQRHTQSPLRGFPPTEKFQHVHVDIVRQLEES